MGARLLCRRDVAGVVEEGVEVEEGKGIEMEERVSGVGEGVVARIEEECSSSVVVQGTFEGNRERSCGSVAGP